ncbi:MAG: cytochrome c biogenesis protein CcsA, partial [Alphaproteobacteria bacterium]
MHYFANPTRFTRLAGRIQPWAGGLTVALLSVGLYLALARAPADYQQGETVRIMFVHVPSSWMALFCYSFLAVASAVALIWKHPLADLAAKASAPIGASFTLLALVTDRKSV